MYTCEPTDQKHLYDLRSPPKLMALILNSSFKFLTSVLEFYSLNFTNVLEDADKHLHAKHGLKSHPPRQRLLLP